MKGKIGLIVGIGVGYVLGTRAGRERYEQIADAARTVWNLDPVQAQVVKVQGIAKSAALALPRTLWNSAVKVTKAATGPGTVSDRIQRTSDEVTEAAPAVKKAAATSAEAIEEVVEDVVEKVTGDDDAPARKTPVKRAPAKKPTTSTRTPKKS